MQRSRVWDGGCIRGSTSKGRRPTDGRVEASMTTVGLRFCRRLAATPQIPICDRVLWDCGRCMRRWRTGIKIMQLRFLETSSETVRGAFLLCFDMRYVLSSPPSSLFLRSSFLRSLLEGEVVERVEYQVVCRETPRVSALWL